MQLLSNTTIDFIGKRKIGFVFSSILILAGIISLIMHGGPRYSIDFTGGKLLHLQFEKDVEIGELRTILTAGGYDDAEITHFGEENEVIIRTALEQVIDSPGHSIHAVIKEAMPDNPFLELQNDTVGPKIGKELKIDAIQAVIWAMILILIYIMWRFEFKFSLGAILALIHDVTITIGVFSLMNIEISAPIIAAVLTIVGYSLNDTIVVYDRIRENLKIKQKDIHNFISIVNKSLNETLSRTIITSLTTLIVVLILFFFGGEVLRSFAFALIVGIVIGTYSSLFIASPFIVEWQIRKASAK
jgi:preprotein translocase subunit SecF